jgi:hypothetical protein
MIEPSLPEVKRYLQDSETTADVTDSRCPRVRSTVVRGCAKSYCDENISSN